MATPPASAAAKRQRRAAASSNCSPRPFPYTFTWTPSRSRRKLGTSCLANPRRMMSGVRQCIERKDVGLAREQADGADGASVGLELLSVLCIVCTITHRGIRPALAVATPLARSGQQPLVQRGESQPSQPDVAIFAICSGCRHLPWLTSLVEVQARAVWRARHNARARLGARLLASDLCRQPSQQRGIEK
jgi:hypothetical protein